MNSHDPHVTDSFRRSPHHRNGSSHRRALRAALMVLALQAPSLATADTVHLTEVAAGLTAPVGVEAAGDGSNRLFIVDQIGVVWVVPDGGGTPAVFLDVRDRIVPLRPGYDERGLLGLAFHPEYEENGRFFVKYTAPLRPEGPTGWSHTNTVSEFSVSSSDPNQADPGSERIVLQLDHPQRNHNGGRIAFGPDGYLYIGEGDGGGANDVGEGHTPLIGNAQDITNLFGSLLRIDVDGDHPYAIPPDNPFVGTEGADEIYAYGLRNPYSFSFDRSGERLLVLGDVGQNLWEEVNEIERGYNYGWNIREADHCFNPRNGEAPGEHCRIVGYRGETLERPVIEYENAGPPLNGIGLAVIGGFIYRGSEMEGFQGRYIFGDYSQGNGEPDGILFLADPERDADGKWSFEVLQAERDGSSRQGEMGHYLKGMGEDERGELYVATTDSAGPTGTSGRVYRLDDDFPAVRASLPRRAVMLAGGPSAGSAPRLELDLGDTGPVTVTIHDVHGRSVRTLADEILPAGLRTFIWDGRDASGKTATSGIYFYRVLTSGGKEQKKFLLVR